MDKMKSTYGERSHNSTRHIRQVKQVQTDHLHKQTHMSRYLKYLQYNLLSN